MGTTNPEQHIKQIRGAFAGAAEFSRVREGFKNCLTFIAEDVNKDENHFIFELMQNADDCEFPKGTDEVPSIKFYLSEAYTVVKINEKGFSRDDVESLCHAGKSTKIARHDQTGEKGLGFKSVFHYSAKPHIFSAGYQFFFNDDCDLGYVCPTWIDNMTNVPAPAYAKNGTTIYLPARQKFTGREKQRAIAQEITSACCALLFLRRIRIVEVFKSVEDEASEVIEKVQGKHGKCSFTIRHVQKMPLREEKEKNMRFVLQETNIDVPPDKLTARRKNTNTTIMLAFPITEDGRASALPQDDQPPIPDVYATLPIRHYGFPFLIQANWELVGSREEIHEDSVMNTFLRDSIANAFCDAFVNIFKENAGLRCTYFRYLPSGVIGFLGQVQTNMVKHLEDTECVFTSCAKWVVPRAVVLPDRYGKCYLVASCLRLRNAAGKFYINGDVPKVLYNNLRTLGAKDFDQDLGFECLKYATENVDEAKKLEWPNVYEFLNYIKMEDFLKDFRGKLYRAKLKLFPVGNNRTIPLPDLEKDLDCTSSFVPIWFNNPKDDIAEKMGVTVLSVDVPRNSPGYKILTQLGLCDHFEQHEGMQQRLLCHALNLSCLTQEQARNRCRFAQRILNLDKGKSGNILEVVKEKLKVYDEGGKFAKVHEVYLPSDELRVMSKLFNFKFIHDDFLKEAEARNFFNRVGVQDVISVVWKIEIVHYNLKNSHRIEHQQFLEFEDSDQIRLAHMWRKTWSRYELSLPAFPENVVEWMSSQRSDKKNEEAESHVNAFLRFVDNNWSFYKEHLKYWCDSFHHDIYKKCEHNENSCDQCKISRQHSVNLLKYPQDVKFLPFIRCLRKMKVPTTKGWVPLQDTFHIDDNDDTLGAAFHSAPRLIQRLNSTSFLEACEVTLKITEIFLLKRLLSLAKKDDMTPQVLNEVISIYKALHERFPNCGEHEIFEKEKVILCLSFSAKASGREYHARFLWKKKRYVRREFYHKDVVTIFQDTELEALQIPYLSPEQTLIVKELLPIYESTFGIAQHPDIADYICALRCLKSKPQMEPWLMKLSWCNNDVRKTVQHVYHQLNYLLSGKRAPSDTELCLLKNNELWFTTKQEWKHINEVYVDDKKLERIDPETFGVNMVSDEYKWYPNLFDSVEARLLSKCCTMKSVYCPGHDAEDDPFWTKRYHRALLSIAHVIKAKKAMIYDDFKQENCKKWRELRSYKIMTAKKILVRYELNGKISPPRVTDCAVRGTTILFSRDSEFVDKLLKPIISSLIFGDSPPQGSIDAAIENILFCLSMENLAWVEKRLTCQEAEWGAPLDDDVKQALLDDSAIRDDAASSSASLSAERLNTSTSGTKVWRTDTTDLPPSAAALSKPPPPVSILALASSTAQSDVLQVDIATSPASCKAPPPSPTETLSVTHVGASSPATKAPPPPSLGQKHEAGGDNTRWSTKSPHPVVSGLQATSEENQKKSRDGTSSTGSVCGETPSEDSGCSTEGKEKGKEVAHGVRRKGYGAASGKGVMDKGWEDNATGRECDTWSEKPLRSVSDKVRYEKMAGEGDEWRAKGTEGQNGTWSGERAEGESDGWKDKRTECASGGWKGKWARGESGGWKDKGTKSESCGWEDKGAKGESGEWENKGTKGESGGWRDKGAKGESGGWRDKGTKGKSDGWEDKETKGKSGGWEDKETKGESGGWRDKGTKGESGGWRDKGTKGKSDGWEDIETKGESGGWRDNRKTDETGGWNGKWIASGSESENIEDNTGSSANAVEGDPSTHTTFSSRNGWRIWNPETNQQRIDCSQKTRDTTREAESGKLSNSCEEQRQTNLLALNAQELQANNHGDGSVPTNISAYAFSQPTGGLGRQGPSNVRRDLSMGQKVLEDIIKENKESKAASSSEKNIEVTRVWVDDVFFTQHSISSTFGSGPHTGQPLDKLVEDLLVGVTHPDFLDLFGAKFRGRIFSMNNRRLFCLKQYQEIAEKKVRTNIKLQPLDAFTARFISGFSTSDDGESKPKIQ